MRTPGAFFSGSETFVATTPSGTFVAENVRCVDTTKHARTPWIGPLGFPSLPRARFGWPARRSTATGHIDARETHVVRRTRRARPDTSRSTRAETLGHRDGTQATQEQG